MDFFYSVINNFSDWTLLKKCFFYYHVILIKTLTGTFILYYDLHERFYASLTIFDLPFYFFGVGVY